jgi:hypothetical protein
VAKLEGDGWLRWSEIGGYVGGRWAAKLVERLLAMVLSRFVSRHRHISKIKNGRHKQRSGLHTLARQKIYKKN